MTCKIDGMCKSASVCFLTGCQAEQPSMKEASMNQTPEAERILECPFCGSAPRVDKTDSRCYVECENAACNANPDVVAVFAHDAIERWNRRAIPQMSAANLAALKADIAAEVKAAYVQGLEEGRNAAPDRAIPQAAAEPVLKAIREACDIAMRHCIEARVPECGHFGAIAQDLSWALDQFAAPDRAPSTDSATERDAARYRWWRVFLDKNDIDLPECVAGAKSADELDIAIDQAIAAMKGEA